LRAFLITALTLTFFGCSTIKTSEDRSSESQLQVQEEKFGIMVQGMRLTSADTMLDFRYKIVDPDKAVPIVDRTIKPYLIDQESGLKVNVPSPAKLGPLRATDKYGKPKAGRTYFVLFGNPGRFIKSGSKVTVVIGEFRAEDLVVQ